MISPLSSGRRSAAGDCLLKGNGATDAVSVGHSALIGLTDTMSANCGQGGGIRSQTNDP
jgi:hypothetical protein